MTADPTTPTARHPAPPEPSDGFHPHAERDEVDAGGIVIPGLRASFHRRPAADGRVETLGLYAYGGRELFAAWGVVGERHCRYNAVRDGLGGWHATRRGCPVLHPIEEGGVVAGLTLLAGDVPLAFRLADLAAGRPPVEPRLSWRYG